MATRSVFVSKKYYPYFEEIMVDFDWFPGFALSQKRKSQISLHHNFLHVYPNKRILEVSSASLYSLGSELSAMHLHKRTALGLTTVESAFQSSRIYCSGNKEIGPFHEYLFLSGKECKKKVKELSKQNLIKGGDSFPLIGDSGTQWGYAFKSNDEVTNPMIISTGYKLSNDTALKIVKKSIVHRVPQPIRISDKISRRLIEKYEEFIN